MAEYPMRKLLKKPLVLFSLFVNLVLGFLCMFFMFKTGKLFFIQMYISYASVAVVSLLRGFSRIHTQSKNMHVIALALSYTFLVLLIGPIVFGLTFSAANALESLQTGILPDFGALFGIIPLAFFGVLFGYIFTAPFFLLNTIFFFLYRANLRKS